MKYATVVDRLTTILISIVTLIFLAMAIYLHMQVNQFGDSLYSFSFTDLPDGSDVVAGYEVLGRLFVGGLGYFGLLGLLSFMIAGYCLAVFYGIFSLIFWICDRRYYRKGRINSLRVSLVIKSFFISAHAVIPLTLASRAEEQDLVPVMIGIVMILLALSTTCFSAYRKVTLAIHKEAALLPGANSDRLE